MTQIKFRVWDIFNKRMIQWDEICADEKLLVDIFRDRINSESKKYITMRYIDRQDTNGLEIYEGDIFKEREDLTSDMNMFIFYDAGLLTYCAESKDGSSWVFYANDSFIVVGNKYENPELAKGFKNG